MDVKRRPSRVNAEAVTDTSMSRRVRHEVVEEAGNSNRESMGFSSEPAFIKVGAGVTKNLGDFESLRVDVAITMPCRVEDIDTTYEELSTKVADMLDSEVDKYLR